MVSDEDLIFGVWRGVRVKKGAAIRSRERSATICNLDRVLPHFGIQGASCTTDCGVLCDMQEILWSALAVQSQGRQINASPQRHLKSSTQIYCSDEVGLCVNA